jgi:uncharacterized protein
MGKLSGFAAKFVARLDSWENAVTGLGGLRDKTTYTGFGADARLTDELLAALYRGDDFARRIVCEVVGEALRQGFDVERQGNEEQSKVSAEQTDAKRLIAAVDKWKLKQLIKKASIRARLFGKAAIVLGLAGLPGSPVNDAAPGKLLYLHVVDKRRMAVESEYDNPAAPKFGEPEIYRIRGKAGRPDALIHESRLVVFNGADTANDEEEWDDSVLQNVYRVLQQVNGNWLSSCNLLADASQGVYYVRGLYDIVLAGNESKLQTRMSLLDMAKSAARSLIMDADGERYERVATPLSGLAEMSDKNWQRLASAAGMPVTKLMGMSPAGMNATGESDQDNWYDTVGEFQQDEIAPRANRLLRLVALAEGIAQPEAWRVIFPALKRLKPLEESQMRKTIAETDAIYLGAKVVKPADVSQSRWGKGTYSTQMVVSEPPTDAESIDEDDAEAA